MSNGGIVDNCPVDEGASSSAEFELSTWVMSAPPPLSDAVGAFLTPGNLYHNRVTSAQCSNQTKTSSNGGRESLVKGYMAPRDLRYLHGLFHRKCHGYLCDSKST